jgi:hypothetical protein
MDFSHFSFGLDSKTTRKRPLKAVTLKGRKGSTMTTSNPLTDNLPARFAFVQRAPPSALPRRFPVLKIYINQKKGESHMSSLIMKKKTIKPNPFEVARAAIKEAQIGKLHYTIQSELKGDAWRNICRSINPKID